MASGTAQLPTESLTRGQVVHSLSGQTKARTVQITNRVQLYIRQLEMTFAEPFPLPLTAISQATVVGCFHHVRPQEQQGYAAVQQKLKQADGRKRTPTTEKPLPSRFTSCCFFVFFLSLLSKVDNSFSRLHSKSNRSWGTWNVHVGTLPCNSTRICPHQSPGPTGAYRDAKVISTR